MPKSALMTKGEFARRCNVKPSRVSHWIADGKISGDALVGTGRAARIVTETALAQLGRRLDPNQMLGNGAKTRISAPKRSRKGKVAEPPPEVPSAGAQDSEPTGEGEPDLRVERARLTRAQAELAEHRLAVEQGEYIKAADAERRWADEMVKLRSRMLRVTTDLPQLLPAMSKRELDVVDRAVRDAMSDAAGVERD